jgi:hypothetical protein
MEIMKKQLKSIVLLLSMICACSINASAQSEQEIDQELTSMLSSGGKLLDLDNIQNSALGQLSSLLTSQLASSLGSSPISEVSALKGVISESYIKQQKMLATQIEIEQEKNMAMTTISPSLASYYNSLDFGARFSDLSNKTAITKKRILDSPINPSSKDYLIAMLTQNNLTGDLKAKIRTATNQNGQIWMSEAERAQIINGAWQELDKKFNLVNAVNQQLNRLQSAIFKKQSRRSKSENLLR